MKIIKRSRWFNPSSSAIMWIMPLITGLVLEANGAILPDGLWVFPVVVGVIFCLWLKINFKIIKGEQNGKILWNIWNGLIVIK